RENAPLLVVRGVHVAHRDKAGEIVVETDGANARFGHSVDGESIDHDVRRAFQVDPVEKVVLRVVADATGTGDRSARLADELDRRARHAVFAQVEADVIAGANGYRVAGADYIGRM